MMPLLGRESWYSLALVRAIILDLFEVVEKYGCENPMANSDKVTHEIELLCPVLYDAGYLRRDGDKFVNTEWGRHFLLPNSPDYLGGYITLVKHQWDMYRKIVEEGPDNGFNEHLLQQNPQYTRDYHLGMKALAVPAGRVFAEIAQMDHIFGQNTPRQIIDLGCGPAVQSLAFLEASPGSTLTLVDLPRVLSELLSYWPGREFGQSVVLKPGFMMELRGSKHDVAMLCNVLHLAKDDEVLELIHHVRKNVLRQNGILIIQDFGHDLPAGDAGTSAFQRAFAYWGLYHSGSSSPVARNINMISGLVKGAGFTWLGTRNARTAIPSHITIWRA